MTRDRDFRLYQLRNRKRRAAKYFICQNLLGGSSPLRAKGILARTPKPCSCWMCGNPRRYFRILTRQERLAEISLHEQEKDAVSPDDKEP